MRVTNLKNYEAWRRYINAPALTKIQREKIKPKFSRDYLRQFNFIQL